MKLWCYSLIFLLLLGSQAAAAEEPLPADTGEAPSEAIPVDEADAVMQAPTEALPEIVNFKGVLKERGTRKPLGDVTVYLKETDYSSTSDTDGSFSFSNLPPAVYQVIIPTTEHEIYETNEEIRAGELTEVTYYLDPKSVGALEVVVVGKREKKEVSRHVLSIEQAKVIPGALGDPVKVVESLPGVARGSTNGGGGPGAGIVIRGSNAEDSRILLDGHEIPILYHFGGLKSVYNAELLDEVNLYTAGFLANYGDATGGIVELKSRKPRKDRWGGYVDTSFIDASAMAEGPLTEGMGMALAVRRSTIDLILPLVLKGVDDLSFTTYPVYYDYQAKWDYQLDKNHSFSFDVYGLYDKMEFILETASDGEPEFTGAFGIENMAHSAIFHYRFKNDLIDSHFSPGYNYIEVDIDLGGKYFVKNSAHVFDINEDIAFRLAENNTLTLGVQLQPRIWSINLNIIRPPKEGDVDTSFSNEDAIATQMDGSDFIGGFFLSDEMTFGPVTIIPGLRFDYYSLLNTYALGPRATVRWQVIEPLVLKFAGGLYNRVPDEDEVLEPFGNGGLVFEKAVHAVAGIEASPVQGLTIDVQGYYKYIYDLVNDITDTETESDKTYDNGADGYVFGGEVLLRYTYSDVFFGWVSYSISQSMRNDGPGTPYRLFDMDQTHNLIVVGSWQFYKGWRLGGRFQFTSGEPYTDITGSILNADNGTYLPLFDQDNKNNMRNDFYHKFDIRLDKTWVFDTWQLLTYLDVQNVYYHANPVATIYNYDYSEKSAFKEIPILPSIGIMAEF